MKILYIFFILLFFQKTTAQTYVFAQLQGAPVNTTGWNFSGAATVGNIKYSDNSEIVLCTNSYYQSGSVFYNQPIDLSLCSKWKAEFDVRMYDGTSADGVSFCFLDVPPSGFVNGEGIGIPGTANGLKIVFDTYPNCDVNWGLMPKIEMRWGQGYDECWTQPTRTNADGGLSFIRSDNYNHVKIEYNAGNINVYVNDNLLLSGFQQFTFPGYLGFTSATGGNYDNHSIRNVIVYTDMPPSDAGNDVTICSGGTAALGTASNPDYVYVWTPATGLSSANISNPLVGISNNTASVLYEKYFVTTSFAANPGCSSVDSVVVAINPRALYTKDTTVCEDASFTLHARDALGYSWTPPGGLSADNVQSPVCTPGMPTTYYLNTTGISGNLVANGNFENGNTGFTTTYSYCNTGNCLYPLAANGYAVGTDASYFHTLFSGKDHTTGTGNFMIINGADPALTVWKQQITVQPNTDYAFGAWISTLIARNTAQVRFSINGLQLGPIFNAPAEVNKWAQVFTTWNSGLNTSATIEIVDVYAQSDGNDFGLDDIFFGKMTTCTDSVHVSIATPVYNTFSAGICAGKSYTLPSGKIITEPGNYKDTVYSKGGCDSIISSVTLSTYNALQKNITESMCTGRAYTLPSGKMVTVAGTYQDTLRSSLGCDSIITTLQLTTYSLAVIKNISAALCAGETYSLPSGRIVSVSGIYNDTLKSLDGCDSSITIADINIATVKTVNLPATICEDTTYTLPWGIIVTAAGIYHDTLHNMAGCDSIITSVNVIMQAKPVINIGKSNDIFCSAGISTLTAHDGITYQWTPAASLDNAAIYNPVASPATTTTYHVSVTNSYGCTNEDSIQVVVNIIGDNKAYVLPSAFTPNNDGFNDCFGIKKWGAVSNLRLSVYNRWGKMIFHTTNYTECWDGNVNGIKSAAGVYVYILTATTSCGNIVRKGTVSLLR